MPKCKGCGKTIQFIKTPAGRPTPVEITPTKIWVVDDGTGQLVKGYESHFANCPNAGLFRNPKIQNQKLGPLQKREGG